MRGSVGLDSKVIVWNPAGGALLRVLTAHQGFVKGIAWDPMGKVRHALPFSSARSS